MRRLALVLLLTACQSTAEKTWEAGPPKQCARGAGGGAAFGVDLAGVEASKQAAVVDAAVQGGLGWARVALDLSQAKETEAASLEQSLGPALGKLDVLAVVAVAGPGGVRFDPDSEAHASGFTRQLSLAAAQLKGKVRAFELAWDDAALPADSLARARLYARLLADARAAVKAQDPDAMVLSAAPLGGMLEATLRDPEHPAARYAEGVVASAPGMPLEALKLVLTEEAGVLCRESASIRLFVRAPAPGGTSADPARGALEAAVATAMFGATGFWPGSSEAGLPTFAAAARLLTGATYAGADPLASIANAARYEFRVPRGEYGRVDVLVLPSGQFAAKNLGGSPALFDALGAPLPSVAYSPPGGFAAYPR